ncbi:MAG TPA: BBP7 family outer membrane beta-barrel protein, partial [Nitrospiraceae bacterium]|nr:BBP7 family outer membrane beta-barrel protein [Nitrospiraceae bacterium]
DDNWTGLAGFRYFGLDEDIESQLNAGPQTFFYDIRTRNQMYGVQLGAASGDFCWDAWRFDASIKAGIFANNGTHNTVLNTGAAVAVAEGNRDYTSFMGELAFMGSYDFTDDWALRFGYQLLWIDNVVLASDQIPVTDFNTATGIASNGDVFYHGAVLGLEYRR